MKLHYDNIKYKIILLFITGLIIGLPIIDTFQFITLLFFLPIIFISEILKKKQIFISIVVFLTFICFKYFVPSLVIQEGHNIVLLNKLSKSYYENNLPKNIYNFFDEQFKFHFNESTCKENLGFCWKSYKPNKDTDPIFAISSNWSLNEIKYSRIVKNIKVSNLTSVKIGISNHPKLSFYQTSEDEVNDIERDDMPFFVMYEIPKLLIDSFFCWKGNVFWEKNVDNFVLKSNKTYECLKIKKSDFGKKIYAVSLGSKNELIFDLKKNNFLKLSENLELLSAFFAIFLILILNTKFNYRIYLFSSIYLSSYILLLFFINKELFYGFDILPGGMDGITNWNYGTEIYKNLIKFNFNNAFEGGEPVFYFLPGLRYFWAISRFIFGESFYGYLLVPFFYTGIIFYIFKNIVGIRWALTITFINFFSNAFDGYALPNMKLINHINVGHAEPLAILLILTCLLIFIMTIKEKINSISKFYSFLLGFFLFLSVSLRPDYLPSAIVMISAIIIYCFFYINKFTFAIFTIIGFSFFLLIPLHNYYYSNQIVLITSNHPLIYNPGISDNTGVPIRIYFNVFFDLIQLKYNENLKNISNQVIKWIRPEQYHYMISIIITLFLLVRSKEFFIKIICLLALSQHTVLLIFIPQHRYAYLAWILTFILIVYFIKKYILRKIILKLKKSSF